MECVGGEHSFLFIPLKPQNFILSEIERNLFYVIRNIINKINTFILLY